MPPPQRRCWQNQPRQAAAFDSYSVSLLSHKPFEFGGTKRMESPGTKQQTVNMDTTTQSYLHTELERRRASLQAAATANVSDASVHQLIHSVDEALARLDGGTFGICEVCHDSIEADRLLCNPLLRFCLDHLSSEEQRALERDLVLAAGIQPRLFPPNNYSPRHSHPPHPHKPP